MPPLPKSDQNLMLARDAMLQSLVEKGPRSRVYLLCEHAYATGVDLVDYDKSMSNAGLIEALECVQKDIAALEAPQHERQSVINKIQAILDIVP